MKRSKSRGRRVSFRLDGDEATGDSLIYNRRNDRSINPPSDSDDALDTIDDNEPVIRGRSQSIQPIDAAVGKSKGKSAVRKQSSSQEDGRGESPVEHSGHEPTKVKVKPRVGKNHGQWAKAPNRASANRGTFVRAQTPGPPSRPVSPVVNSSRSGSAVRPKKASYSK